MCDPIRDREFPARALDLQGVMFWLGRERVATAAVRERHGDLAGFTQGAKLTAYLGATGTDAERTDAVVDVLDLPALDVSEGAANCLGQADLARKLLGFGQIEAQVELVLLENDETDETEGQQRDDCDEHLSPFLLV